MLKQEWGKSFIIEYLDQWRFVDRALREGTVSGYKISVVETEKILAKALDDNKFYGRNISHKIKNSEAVLSNPEKLKYSRAMYNKIIKESGFDISPEDAKEIISGYCLAISDICKSNRKNLSFVKKIDLFFKKHFEQLSSKIKKLSVILFLFLLLIFIITETQFGNIISKKIVDFTRLFFYKVIPAVLAIITFLFLIRFIVLYWLEKRKGN